jgi:hypothetical protein
LEISTVFLKILSLPQFLNPQRRVQRGGITKAAGIKTASVFDTVQSVLHRVFMDEAPLRRLLKRHIAGVVHIQQRLVLIVQLVKTPMYIIVRRIPPNVGEQKLQQLIVVFCKVFSG